MHRHPDPVSLLAALLAALGCAPLAHLERGPNEHAALGRLLDHEGKPLAASQVNIGDRPFRVEEDGSFAVPLAPKGLQVLRFSGVFHEAIEIPLVDPGRDVDIEVRLGTPEFERDLSHAAVLGEKTGLHPLVRDPVDGTSFEACIPEKDRGDGLVLAGVVESMPLSVPGAARYQPDAMGRYYWSHLENAPGPACIWIDPRTWPEHRILAQVAFADPGDASLWNALRWRNERSEGVRRGMAASHLDSPGEYEALRAGAARRGTWAQELSERVDRSSGFERQLWMLDALASLPPGDAPELLQRYARELVAAVPAPSPLWSLYPDALRALMRASPDEGQALGDRLIAENQDRSLVGLLLLERFMDAVGHKDLDRAGALRAEMERRVPGSPWLALASRSRGVLLRGDPAPELDLPQRTTAARLRLDMLRGRTVLLAFWGTYCGKCTEAFPTLKALRAKYSPKELFIVGVAVDDDLEAVGAFVDSHRDQVTWPVTGAHGDDAERIQKAFAVTDLPSFLLIGPDGRIAATAADFERNGLETTVVSGIAAAAPVP